MSELVRANRISVQPNDNGFIATFYRTHNKLGAVESRETAWKPMEGLNGTAQRELFRVYVIEHCAEFGYKYDAQDRRTEDNQLPRTYGTDELLGLTATRLVRSDIEEWTAKVNADMKDKNAVVSIEEISYDDIAEVVLTKSGKDVKPRYNNGNWAWAEIEISVTLLWKIGKNEPVETYVTMKAELVSGQLKKPSAIGTSGYNYTGYKAEAMVDINEQLPIDDKTKKEAEDEPKKDTPKDEPKAEEQPVKYPDWVVLKKDGTPNKKSMERLQAEGLAK